MKKVKFPLILKGVNCNTIDALKTNIDEDSFKELIGYFHDKRLLRWLNDRAYDEEAEAVAKLTEDDPHFKRQLCEIFEIDPNTIPDIDTEEEIWRQERLNRLKQYTDDESILEKIDQVAFDQEELGDRLNEELNEIILVNNEFRISTKRENKTYIGIGKVTAVIKSDIPVDFDDLNIKFVDVKFDDKYLKVADKPVNNEKLPTNEMYQRLDKEISEWQEDQLFSELAKLRQEFQTIINDLKSVGVKTSDEDIYKMSKDELLPLANEGNMYAMKELITYYELRSAWNEHGALKKAVIWYKLAISKYKRCNSKLSEIFSLKEKAESGDANAMNELANAYEKGEGVTKNIFEAMNWHKKAAEKGNIDSMLKRAEYLIKQGKYEDKVAAKKYYEKAAALGSKEAQERLKNAGGFFSL